MESTTIRVQVPKTSTQIKPLRRLAQIKFTPETVHDMKLYLTDGVLPNGSAAAQQRFRARCVGFKVLHNHLMYERGERSLEPAPGEPVVLIPVILPDEVQKTLKYFYNLETTVAKGVNQMFYFITQRCIGITRKEVNTFLHAQTTYQISFHRRNIPGRAYLCTAPLQYVAIDLVDVHYYANSNNGVTFIMSFIDLFSRFAYFAPCHGKFATATKAAFKSFIRFMHVFGAGDRFPTHVVSDNGKEFMGELDTYFRANGVDHVTTPAYRPQPHVEEINRELRRLLRTTFVKNNNHRWVNELGNIADSMNSNYNSTLQATPEQVMQAFYNDDDLTDYAARANAAVQKNFTSNYAQNHLQVLDRVRVRMSSLHSMLRDREKAETSKKTVVRFTPQIYIVNKIIPPKPNQLGFPVYFLMGPNHQIVRTSPEGPPRTFNAGELLLVPNDAKVPFTDARAAALNRVRFKKPPAAAVVPPPPPPPPPAPVKPPVEWRTKEWGEALVGKEFTAGVRCSVVGVEYSRKDKTYLVEYVETTKLRADGTFSRRDTEQQTLRDALEDMRGEPWYVPPYDAVIAKYS